ncbi:ABC transporter permease [Haoranjiania flava]|uniref:ABC transporter permease n=1 Tax=Haoranjiania flava TaxID=1856322 RepID=A0AAE3IPM8_9BACT|nr:ABC transporter permease [Haoranjiania flava]MCU7694821.1 ABC transporter permease [Haoranjiania flava]
MIKNYFKTAWRNLLKGKFFSALNLIGLAVGLAAGIMILMWVHFQYSFNSHIKDADKIFSVNIKMPNNGEIIHFSNSTGVLKTLSASIPEIESVMRLSQNYVTLLTYGSQELYNKSQAFYADSNFFKFFSHQIVAGDKKSPLALSNSIVINETTARYLFGNDNPIGKTLKKDNSTNYVVTAVMKDFPKNTSIRPEILFSMAELASNFTNNGGNGVWKTIDEDMGNYAFYSFIKARNESIAASALQKISKMFIERFPHKEYKAVQKVQFFPMKFTELNLRSVDGKDTNLKLVRLFLAIGILILVIACINYVNLSTARAIGRMKEVGMRKITGANKIQIFTQFVFETTLLFGIAALGCLLMLYFFIPLFNKTFMEEGLEISLFDPGIWKVILVMFLATLAAAAVYPAIFLSSFKPMEVFQKRHLSSSGNSYIRRALVVLQFFISIVLIIATIIITRQMNYIRKMDLGYDQSYVLTAPMKTNMVMHTEAVLNELRKDPSIQAASVANGYISSIQHASGDYHDADHKPGSIFFYELNVEPRFIPAMQLSIAKGKNFSGTPGDSTSFILNETAIKKLAIKDPIGKEITYHDTKGTIIGIVKDFHFHDLHQPIAPLIMSSSKKGWNSVLYVKTTAQNAQRAIEATKRQWVKYTNEYPFEYTFLDESFAEQYKSDINFTILIKLFGAIAILISCLGLLGLAAYSTEVRRKEIGVRKVLGANAYQISAMLNADFLKLVLISFVFALPAGWWAMHKWLQGFAYRTQIEWWIFVFAGTISILIALIAVSTQSVKAALTNPIKSLRTE